MSAMPGDLFSAIVRGDFLTALVLTLGDLFSAIVDFFIYTAATFQI